MSLQTEIEQINNTAENEDDSSSTSEETTSTSPKRQNQKNTPPATATRKSTRNRQATLATAQGNPIPISTVQITSTTGTKQFEIYSPPEKSKQDSPSLKSLIQEMGFLEKTPEYKACVQFIQAISPKHKTSTTNNVIDLISSAEAEYETIENDDIFCVITKDIETKQGKVDEQPNNEEEHGTIDDNIDNNTEKTRGEK